MDEFAQVSNGDDDDEDSSVQGSDAAGGVKAPETCDVLHWLRCVFTCAFAA
jgi:hypothetical protein